MYLAGYPLRPLYYFNKVMFNIVHPLCNYITYITLNTNFCTMFLLIIAPSCFGLSSWPSSGSSQVCAAYKSTYLDILLNQIEALDFNSFSLIFFLTASPLCVNTDT